MSMTAEMELDQDPLFEAPVLPAESEDENSSSEAPYGVTGDGKPKAKPGRKPGQRTGTGRAAKRTVPAPPARKAAPRPAAPKSSGTTDYRPALGKLIGEAVGSVAVIGLMRDDMTLLADAATVADAVPAIVEVTNLAAEKWPVVAAILDRLLPIGEFAKGGGAIVVMCAQLAVNHGKLPPGLVPGTMPRDAKVSSFIEQQIKVNPDFAGMISAIHDERAKAAAASSM